MKASRYILSILFLGVVAPTGITFAVNCAIDPYYEWRFAPSYAFGSINEFDPRARVSRAYQIRYIHPKHIVLGSSRCVLGIDQNYEAWPEGPCYNLAVFGSGIDETLAFLRHAQEINPLDTVVLGLDLFSFNQTKMSPLATYEEVLSYNDRRFGWQVERLRATVSINTLSDSWKLYKLSKSSDGNSPQTDLHVDPQMYRTLAASTVRWYFPENEPRFSFKGNQDRSSFEIYRQILAFCHENDIHLKLFIPPSHAVELEMIDAFGLWDTLEIWKRQLVKDNEETAAQFGKQPYPLWDFAGYNSFTTEPVPQKDDSRGSTRYYSDPGHFNHTVGNSILDTIFDRASTPAFGDRLTAESIDHRLAQVRRDKVMWREANPEVALEFATLARNARPVNAIIDSEF